MKEDLKYPEIEAAKSVLMKIGIDPVSRISGIDQDFEYTSCEVAEIDKYLELYCSHNVSDKEKRVLGCFLLQSLNDYIGKYGETHPKQEAAIDNLFKDIEINGSEIEYWRDEVDVDQDNWWYITEYLKRYGQCT